jgi:hypothetical protein
VTSLLLKRASASRSSGEWSRAQRGSLPFKPLAYLAVLLSVSHMMVSQASSGRGA